jgi:hypothetical protein
MALRSTAFLAILFGAIKETRGIAEPLFSLNLKDKIEELINFPTLNTFSTILVSALFFLANILFSYLVETDSFFLPFWRLRLSTALPVFVRDRTKKPWALARFRFLG